MSLIIPPGYGNAAFIFSADSGTPEFVTTLGIDLSAFGGDYVEAANTLMTYYSQRLGSLTDSNLSLDRVTLSVGSDGPGGSVDSDLPPITMGRSGTQAPFAMAAIARKVTAELGRRGRGRMFLPAVLSPSEVDEGGNISGSRLGTISNALGLFYGDLTGGASPLLAAPPVLLHSSAPADPSPITGFAVATLVGWVRGRIR